MTTKAAGSAASDNLSLNQGAKAFPPSKPLILFVSQSPHVLKQNLSYRITARRKELITAAKVILLNFKLIMSLFLVQNCHMGPQILVFVLIFEPTLTFYYTRLL